ncbi:MAG: hypothetical protein H0V21_11430 [Rubrobacter sp.]|nr:hypothetical protein [Rubrobacter sp.]
MERAIESLPLPDEPTGLKAETRALLEESPEEGGRVISDAAFVSDSLWEEWGAELEDAGIGYDRFVEISRGYAGEFRLWVVGERPWDHCAAGLAGRLLRRLPARQATILAEVEL